MEFKIQAKNESSFESLLREIIEDNNIQPYSQKTIERDGDYSTFILEDVFINRLPQDSITRLQSIK